MHKNEQTNKRLTDTSKGHKSSNVSVACKHMKYGEMVECMNERRRNVRTNYERFPEQKSQMKNVIRTSVIESKVPSNEDLLAREWTTLTVRTPKQTTQARTSKPDSKG